MRPNQMYKILQSKETINNAERQPTDWEKIFTNDTTKQRFSFQNTQIVHTTQKQ